MIGAVNQSPTFGTGYILRSKEKPGEVVKAIVDFADGNGVKIGLDKIEKLPYSSDAGNHYLFNVKDNVKGFWKNFKEKFGDNAFKC